MSLFFARLGKFPVIIASYRVSIPSSLSLLVPLNVSVGTLDVVP